VRPILRALASSRLLLALAGLAFFYFSFMGIEKSVRLYQLLRQEERVQQELASLDWDYQRLQALREYFNTDEYIESQARRILGWVRPGEKGIIVITPSGEGEEPQALRPGLRWWEAFFEK